MRNYFTLNGVDSRDFGVYINGQGTYSAPEKDYTFYQIPGRSGDIIGSENRLMNIEITYHAFIYADFDNNMAAFRSFLLSLDGYQRLEDSYHPDEFRMACYTGPFDPAVTVVNDAGEFDIVFNCKPQRFLKSGETSYSFVANAEDIPVDGTSLHLYGYSLNRSVFKAEWPITRGRGSGDPSPSNPRFILGPLLPLVINIDGEQAYSAPIARTDIAAAEADLVAGTNKVLWKMKNLPSTGWTMTSSGIFQLTGQGTESGGISSHYMPYSVASPDFTVDTSNGTVIVRDSRFSTVMAFREWLASNIVQIAWPLATPITGGIETGPTLPDEWFNIESAWTLHMALDPEPVMLNPTVFPSQPLIRIFGAGTFTLNDITVTVSQADEYTDVDCELMDCYKGNVNKNQYVSFSTYDFPVLKSGQNTVEFAGGVTAVTIIPRWWRV